MGGDFALNSGRNGFSREDPSRNLGVSYGSFGPWAGAVMRGAGAAVAPMSPMGVIGLGLQGATGKSILDHALGMMGINGGLLSGNPAATGLTPDQMMAAMAGNKGGANMGGGGLLDILGNAGFSSGPNHGMNAGAMG